MTYRRRCFALDSSQTSLFLYGHTCKWKNDVHDIIISFCLIIQTSQMSVNSVMSQTKARYELNVTGTIQLKLSYNLKINSLDIFISKCNNLALGKQQQTSNPYVCSSSSSSSNPTNFVFFSHRYCKTYLLPDKSKNSKRKTTVQKHTTNPSFNETLRVSDYLISDLIHFD